MRRRHDRNRLLRHVDPESLARLVNVRESLADELRRFVGDIQKHALRAGALDLRIDRTGHDVARSERAPRIIPFHKILAAIVAQNSAFAAHGFRDEK